MQRARRRTQQLGQRNTITADACSELHHGRALSFEHARQARQQYRITLLQMRAEALARGQGNEFVQRTSTVKRADVTAACSGVQLQQQHAVELELGMLMQRRLALRMQQRTFAGLQGNGGIMQAGSQRSARLGKEMFGDARKRGRSRRSGHYAPCEIQESVPVAGTQLHASACRHGLHQQHRQWLITDTVVVHSLVPPVIMVSEAPVRAASVAAAP